MTTFIRYRDSKKEWRWRATSKGRVKADSGEGYKHAHGCERAIQSLIRDCATGKVRVPALPNRNRK